MSYADIEDPKKARDFDQIVKKCETSEKCKRISCSRRIIITYLYTDDDTDEDFTIILAMTQRPWTQIDHSPSVYLITYITYLMGTFSTWTGLSIISFSPFKLIIKRRERANRMKNTLRTIETVNQVSMNRGPRLFLHPEQFNSGKNIFIRAS